MENDLDPINVYLCFSGFDIDPDTISQKLDLPPLAARKKGVIENNRSVPNSRSFWSTGIVSVIGDDIGDALDLAIKSLTPKQRQIVELSHFVTDQQYIAITVSNTLKKPLLNFSPESLNWLGEARLSLDIELF